MGLIFSGLGAPALRLDKRYNCVETINIDKASYDEALFFLLLFWQANLESITNI